MGATFLSFHFLFSTFLVLLLFHMLSHAAMIRVPNFEVLSFTIPPLPAVPPPSCYCCAPPPFPKHVPFLSTPLAFLPLCPPAFPHLTPLKDGPSFVPVVTFLFSSFSPPAMPSLMEYGTYFFAYPPPPLSPSSLGCSHIAFSPFHSCFSFDAPISSPNWCRTIAPPSVC